MKVPHSVKKLKKKMKSLHFSKNKDSIFAWEYDKEKFPAIILRIWDKKKFSP